MLTQKIGILHPGAMGIFIAAEAQKSGHDVYWASEGRSGSTCNRAARYQLIDAKDLSNVCAECSIIISVCPPHAAEAVAHQILAHAYTGVYLDANAISPKRVARIGQAMINSGATFVDGGIIGGPAWESGHTWLYLSGPRAQDFTSLFTARSLRTRILDQTIGTASALKMCYSGYAKGATALLSAVLATADHLNVRGALQSHWELDDPAFAEHVSRRVAGGATKAWRFAGEMGEVAATFSEAGMPGDFHDAAATVFRRLAPFKESRTAPTIEAVLAALKEADC